MKIPERISVSQARVWNTCRYQWRLRHVDRAEGDTPVGFAYGRALHAALAVGYDAIRMRVASAAGIRALALEALAITWEEEGVPWSEDYPGACEIIERQFRDEVVAAHVANGDVLAVEQFLIVELDGWTNDGVRKTAKVSVIIDLVLAHPDGGVEIRDHKLGAPREAGGNRQLAIYGEVWERDRGDRVAAVSLSFPTGGELDVRALEDGWRDEAVRWILTARDEIDTFAPLGDLAPNPSVRNCSRCDYTKRCPAAVVSDRLQRALD